MENRSNTKLTRQQQEWQKALMQKSEEELKTMLNEEGIYGAELIRFVRKELTGRVAGSRCQKTAEEIREEEERLRCEEEERLHAEEEKQQRLAVERAAEAARREAQNRKLAKQAGIIAAIVVVVGSVIGLLVWNQTPERLLERGRKALATGNEGKAEKFFKQAAETEKDAAFELWRMKKSYYYLKKAADLHHSAACGLYGEKLMKDGTCAGAVPYLKNALNASATVVYSENSDHLFENYLHYLLGCAYWANRDWKAARNELEKAADNGYTDAMVRLGDWYLCRGELRDYTKALEYYENAPANWPGVKEKRQVLRDLKKYGRNFSSDSWSNMRFYGEHSYWEQKSVRRGIVKNKETGYRYFGRFSSSAAFLSGLGIIANETGSIYAGNIKVNSTKSGYTLSYSGKGSETDPFSGAIKTGQWKDDRLVDSYTLTDIFGQTENKQ